MTPKEKAQELFDKFRVKVHDRDGTSAMNGFEAKQCALIAVDEILDLKHIVTLRRNMHEMELDFWDEVKEEIKAL
jgi:hypothetical protein